MCYLAVLEELNVLPEGVFYGLLMYISQLKGILSCKYFPDVGWYLQ